MRLYLLMPVLALCCGAAHADHEYAERSVSTFPVGLNARLTIRTEVGEVRIHASDRHDVLLRVTKRYQTSDDAEGAAKVKELHVNTSSTGNELRIIGQWPSHGFNSLLKGESKLQMDFELDVPRDARIFLTINVGSVHMDGVESDIDVTENIGDVNINGNLHPRLVRLETDIGDVSTNLKGTTSGMVGKKFTSILDGDHSLNVKVHIGAVTVHSSPREKK